MPVPRRLTTTAPCSSAPCWPRRPPAAVDVAPVDVREIGTFGAINPVIAAANPLLMMVPHAAHGRRAVRRPRCATA